MTAPKDPTGYWVSTGLVVLVVMGAVFSIVALVTGVGSAAVQVPCLVVDLCLIPVGIHFRRWAR